ncbi:serine/threonine protein kinase [Labilithrix luteola]|uniref:Serine/threonine protein kinase n=1 Tax=Labilithrix luteola TaxID=1391654 RepID=A0A0K1Q1M4_9BACT|nr:serine/threonine protein kinase [Labilithrix luteola]
MALKVLHHATSQDTDADARFVREARIAGQLSHPNIVFLYETGTIDGVAFLALEWVDGVSLSVALRNGLPYSIQNRVLTEVAEALAFAHERGVVHRDVKPGNVLVSREGNAKLADFGIARQTIRTGPDTFATREGMILGTPAYMAPEQSSSADVGPAADQFSWGVLAYQVLTGQHPRDVVGPSFPFAGPLPFLAPVPAAAENVIRRALSLDPTARFASMRALLEAFNGASNGAEGGPGTALTFVEGQGPHRAQRASIPIAKSDAPAPPLTPNAAPSSHRSAAGVVIGTLAVLSLGGLATAGVLLHQVRSAEAQGPGMTTTVAPAPSGSALAPDPSSASAPNSSAPPNQSSVPSASAPPPRRLARETPAGPTPPTKDGNCLCMPPPTPYVPEHPPGISLCPKVPTLGECRDNDSPVCPPSIPRDACSNWTTTTGAHGSVCSGLDTGGNPRTGKIEKHCEVDNLYSGRSRMPCRAYTNAGKLVTGIFMCR